MEQTANLDIEAEFHDQVEWGNTQDLIYSFGIQELPEAYALNVMKQRGLHGKVLVELGCGAGEHFFKFSELGARIFGIDISKRAIDYCRETVVPRCSSPVTVEVGDAHKLNVKDHSVDFIYGRAILHHLDIPKMAKEIDRALTPNGQALFIEPLGHNPFINLFRKLTPGRRTPGEKPITMSDLDLLGEKFNVSYKSFYFLAILALVFNLVKLPKVSEKLFMLISAVEQKLGLDRIFARFCWIAVLVLERKK